MLGITSPLFLKLKNKTFSYQWEPQEFTPVCHILNSLENYILIISPLPFFRTNQIHRTVLLEFVELHGCHSKVLGHIASKRFGISMAISLCFSLSVPFSHQSPSLLAASHLVTILPSFPSLDPVIYSSCRAAGCKLQLRPFSRTEMKTMQNNLGTIQRALKVQSVGLQWVNLSNKFQ